MTTKHEGKGGEQLPVKTEMGMSIGRAVDAFEQMDPLGKYRFTCRGPSEADRPRYVKLRDQLLDLGYEEAIDALARGEALRSFMHIEAKDLPLWDEFRQIPLEEKWVDDVHNLVVTQGKNDLLDKYLAGSAYTAAFFLGLVSSVAFAAYAAGDTAAQINGTNGWKEAAGTNAPNYSQGTRPAPSWSAAAGGSKATSAAVVFSITSAGTVKGGFLVTTSAKDGTTGVLFSAGNFTGGDKVVGNGDTINATYTLSV